MNFLTAPYTFSFKYPVWKIHPNLENSNLLIETRDALSKSIHLYEIDIQRNNSVMLPLPSLGDKWWCTLEIYKGHTLIFSHNDDPNLPMPTSIFCMDLKKQEKLWQLDRSAIKEVYNEGFKVLDHHQNTVCYDFEGRVSLGTDWSIPQLKTQNGMVCTSENIIFQDFLLFLNQNKLPSPHQQVEYFENDHFLILAYGHINHDTLEYKLLIFNANGEKVVDEHIFKNNKGLIQACFFIFGNSVLFLDNDYCLKGYEIS